jgi:predicted phage terminase large subunit-like protein
MTRWHMDDLASSLLREEDVTRVGWHVVEMPAEKRVERTPSATAIAVDPLTGVYLGKPKHVWPATVTVEPDARDHPKWLWTQRFTIEEYELLKVEQGGESGYFWNALYQQRPVANEGGLFKREYFKPIARTSLPKLVMVVRWWDLGATEDGGAYTAGLKVGKDAEGKYYILGLQHGQWHPGPRDQIIKKTAERDTRRVTVLFPQDPGAAGKQVAMQHIRMLSGIAPARCIIESGDKDTRATLPASDAANGLFYIVDEPWAATVLQELADFGPGAEFRDIVDALSGAHGFLSGKRERNVPQSTSMRSLRR